MASVDWSDEALAELNQVIAYIRAFDPAAARRFARRLDDAGESLAEFPRRGRPGPGGSRELIGVPPYVLRYVVRGDAVTVIGIRHGRRRPGAAPADPA